MSLLAFLSHDVAQSYGDQDGDGDAHTNADPYDFFIDSTVISTCKINIQEFNHIALKYSQN